MQTFLRGIVVFLLTAEARLVLSRHKPKIIAITGNVGKTTTKDAIFSAVSGHYITRKSLKSFNSDIGVPLAILGLDNPWSNPFLWLSTLIRGLLILLQGNYPKLLVLEVGADKPGDIRSIASWLKPDIAVFTGVPKIPAHVGFFDSPEALVKEKSALFEYLKSDGILIANGDNEYTATLPRNDGQRFLTYGFDSKNTIAASDAEIMYTDEKPIGMSTQITGVNPIDLKVYGALGTPCIYAALAACAVAKALEIDVSVAASTLGGWEPTPGRMRILNGINDSVIIDDSYNSSPTPALSALETLKLVRGTRKIAVLGDMRELGALSIKGHQEVGKYAAGVADVLITVGIESKVLAEAAREAGMPKEGVREYGYGSAEKVGKELAREVRPGDIVLIKGSQNHIRLERAAYELLRDKQNAEKLLVRYDSAWRSKV